MVYKCTCVAGVNRIGHHQQGTPLAEGAVPLSTCTETMSALFLVLFSRPLLQKKKKLRFVVSLFKDEVLPYWFPHCNL